MRGKIEIRQIAFAKACCLRGFRHFFVRGPLTWFLLVYLYGITLGMLKGKSPTLFGLTLNLIVTLVAAFVVGKIAFSVFQWQIRKWDQSLTENEIEKVRAIVESIRPFRQVNIFVILFVILGLAIRFIW